MSSSLSRSHGSILATTSNLVFLIINRAVDSKGKTVWEYKTMTGKGTLEDPRVPVYGECVYYFGMDHVWGMSTNSIIFNNSLKMKLAIVLGVSHMCFGILLKGLNDIHMGSVIGFICEFIPMILFFAGLFGYMVLLIILKWITDWTAPIYAAVNLFSLKVIGSFYWKSSTDYLNLLWYYKQPNPWWQIASYWV
jgi:hypothetical protein